MGEILLVDDEPVIRRSFSAMLEAEGHKVRTARNGAEGVAKFAERRSDLVLLDVMMPKMNGITACGEIRKIDALVPILFFTAVPSEATLVRALGLGGDDYIEKSKTREEISARIRAALRRRAEFDASRPRADVLDLGGVKVNLSMLTVSGEGMDEVITRSEAQLLNLLSSERGRFYSADEIFSALHGDGYVGGDSSLRTLVSRLKVKLGRKGALILNDRARGYALARM